MTELAIDADPEHIVLRVVGKPLKWPEDTWRTDVSEQLKWFSAIRDAVSEHDPWALLGQRPDGDVFVYGTSRRAIEECSAWATTVWLMDAINLHAKVEALTHDGLTAAQSQVVLKRKVLELIDGGSDG